MKPEETQKILDAYVSATFLGERLRCRRTRCQGRTQRNAHVQRGRHCDGQVLSHHCTTSSESGSARLGWYRMSCTSNKCVVLLYLNILKSYYSHYSPPLFAHSITWWITGELTTHQKLNIKPPKKAGLVLNTMHSLNNVPPDQFFS